MGEMVALMNKLEYIFLKVLVTTLRDETMTVEEAQLYSGEFLKIDPFTSIEDAKTKIYAFVEKYPAFAPMKTYVDSYKDEQKINGIINKMSGYLKQNDVDSALEVAKPS